ncbi:OmpA family protein [Pontibacter sp. 13R65]|uniref:OmpA family protein n=1 Tax=Pontibacter sp. 13R65 TaxID=3127458 RepID=UPI00301CEFBF
MADLDVQPKKGRPGWLWIVLALIGIALLFFLLRGCNDNDNVNTTDPANTTDTTAATTTSTRTRDWNAIDFNAPTATYSEVSDKDIEVRGNEEYAIYSLDEALLFDTGKSEIKSSAEAKLKQISASVSQRYKDGEVRVYGHTDTQGSADTNQELAEKRAESVKNWLTNNTDLSDDNISVHPVGESQPVASNETAAGRQQNRRVEIVAIKNN